MRFQGPEIWRKSIDFRKGNDQYTRSRGGGGWDGVKVFIVSKRHDGRVFLRIRPTGGGTSFGGSMRHCVTSARRGAAAAFALFSSLSLFPFYLLLSIYLSIHLSPLSISFFLLLFTRVQPASMYCTRYFRAHAFLTQVCSFEIFFASHHLDVNNPRISDK